MRLPPLTDGIIVRRYQRFLADVEIADGRRVTAHCPNTGTMATCWRAGVPVQLSHSDNPNRKLPWTLERVDMGGGWVGVHTGRTNPVMAEAIEGGLIAPLRGYRRLRREASFRPAGLPGGRLDILLSEGEGPDALVEVKNATLLDGERIRFPDAVSERGKKHLDLLAEAVRQGLRGALLFAVNRPEGTFFAPAWRIDPAYAARLCEVAALGVEVLAVRIRHEAEGLRADGLVSVDLSPPQ
jgi:sugar fermentation stimulation protein A